MDRFLFTSLVAGLVVASTAGAQTPAVAPDLVLRNGHIFTGDKANPWVEAISIRGERIVLAGSNAVVVATVGTQTSSLVRHLTAARTVAATRALLLLLRKLLQCYVK